MRSHLRGKWAIFAAWIALSGTVLRGMETFFVATTGSDANPGSSDRPFATPIRARDALREAKARGDTGPFVVELRGGLYELPGPLALTAEDSGAAAAPVTWRSAPNEQAVLSGGRVVSGFSENVVAGIRRWQVTLPEVPAGRPNFRQLFVSTNNQPFERRYRPHLGMKRVAGLTYSPRRVAAAHRAAQIDFVFAPGDIQLWENLSEVEVVILHVWSSSRLFIQNVNLAKNIVTFTGMPTFAVDQGGLQPYYVENVKEELKVPGQWYLDRPTGVLTYLPLTGETLANTRVVIPRLPQILTLGANYQGNTFVSYVNFENLAFSFNESVLPPEGYGGSQGHPDLPAAIELVGARNCTFTRCTVSQVGNYGINLGLGTQASQVIGCRLFDLGGGGVKVGDSTMSATAKSPALPIGNRVENCAIYEGGVMYFSSNAIWGGIINGTVIRHNRIWNFPYSGIAVGWHWDDESTSCGSNRIEGNLISSVLTLLADGGSIYTLGRQPGTVIRENVVRDNVRGPFTNYYWQLGLYLDEGSSEILVEKNLSYRVGTHGFNMNGGSQNIIRNNIFGPVYDRPGTSEGYVNSADKAWGPTANVFTRNLLYFDSVNMVNAAWPVSHFNCSSNLYWNFAGKPFQFAGRNFAEWQAGGQDAGSRNADPLFLDPTNGDFRLQSNSPALALGFETFDFQAAGLEASFADIGVPAKVVRPPVYALPAPAVTAFTGFALALEDVPVGAVPNGFTVNGGSPEATFQVADGVGKSGGRALVATDSRNALKPFYPYLFYQIPSVVNKGTVAFSCDVLQAAGAAATLGFDFRDYSRTKNTAKDYIATPSLSMAVDGSIRCGGLALASSRTGSWTHIEISCPLEGATRQVTFAATLADGTRKETRLPLDGDFSVFTTLGIYCSDAVDGRCYLDNLVLKIEDNSAPPLVVPASRLSNVSVRTTLAANQVLTVGFVLQGAAKPVLVRAAGPSLSLFNVTGFMANPRLALFDGGSQQASNDDWAGDTSVASASGSVSAFPFIAPTSLDAALVRSVAGSRTVQVAGPGPGNVLVEVYDAGPGMGSRLTNLSALNVVGTGGDVLIAGFTLSGSGKKTVLIRAVGPSLAPLGVSAVLSDPRLDLFDASQSKIGENDNYAAALATTFASVGAFGLLPGSKDAALVVSLPPGGYSVMVSGVNNTTGIGLVEIYDLDF